MRLGVIVFGTVVVFLGGCATTSGVTDRVTATETTIRVAREMGAGKTPRAALHLQLAQEQVDQAKVLLNDSQEKQADLALLRAQADAELALALAREATAATEAEQAVEQVKSLKKAQP